MIGGLYTIENPIGKAMGGMQQAASTAASMDKEKPTVKPAKKTVGGTLQNTAGGALMGYTMSPMIEGLFGSDAIQLPDESEGLELMEEGPLGEIPGFTKPASDAVQVGVDNAMLEGSGLSGLSTAEAGGEAAGTYAVKGGADATFAMSPGTLGTIGPGLAPETLTAAGLSVEGGATTVGLATEGMSATGGALVAGNTGASLGTSMAAGSMGGAAAGGAAGAGTGAAAGTAATTTAATTSTTTAAGSSLGSATAAGASTGSSAGWWGAAIGAVIGASTYLFS